MAHPKPIKVAVAVFKTRTHTHKHKPTQRTYKYANVYKPAAIYAHTYTCVSTPVNTQTVDNPQHAYRQR